MSPARMEKVEAASRMGLALVEAMNRRAPEVGAALFCDDGVWETETPAPDGAVHRGRAAVDAYLRVLIADEPETRLTVEEVLGMGLRCVVRFRATRRGCSVRGIGLVQLRGGLIGHLVVFTKH